MDFWRLVGSYYWVNPGFCLNFFQTAATTFHGGSILWRHTISQCYFRGTKCDRIEQVVINQACRWKVCIQCSMISMAGLWTRLLPWIQMCAGQMLLRECTWWWVPPQHLSAARSEQTAQGKGTTTQCTQRLMSVSLSNKDWFWASTSMRASYLINWGCNLFLDQLA